MVRLVFGIVMLFVVVALFTGGIEAAFVAAAVFGAAGLLFCAPWIAMGDY